KRRRDQPAQPAMQSRAKGAKNMSTIQLPRGQKVQRRGKKSNPRGASNGMKQDRERIRSWENSLHQQAKRKRYAKHDVCRRRIESRHDSRMHNAVNQDRDRQYKSRQRS